MVTNIHRWLDVNCQFGIIHIKLLQNGGNLECPDLDFVYNDTDTQINEIAELYSYTEQNEFHFNAKVIYTPTKRTTTKIFAKFPVHPMNKWINW